MHTKLQDLLKRNSLGTGSNSYIISNVINTASSSMSIDVQVLITNIYISICLQYGLKEFFLRGWLENKLFLKDVKNFAIEE